MQLEIDVETNTSLPEAMLSERFSRRGRTLVREVRAGRFSSRSTMDGIKQLSSSDDRGYLSRIWALNRLRGFVPSTQYRVDRTEIRTVDLFCGIGGLATGFRWACEAVGIRSVVCAAVDTSRRAMAIYRMNLRPLQMIGENVANLIDYETDVMACEPTRPQILGNSLRKLVGDVDVVLAGPPCEGNSNLNNHSRYTDKRNELYVAAISIAIALRAKVIVIENVTTVRSAKQLVVHRSLAMLKRAGYKIQNNEFVLDASHCGTAQRRRRHFLIASRCRSFESSMSPGCLWVDKISALDAIEGIEDGEHESLFDQPSQLSPENQRRIEFLFNQAQGYDLPDSERPDCHKNKDHSYRSVYGRMLPDEPAQTITTGFLSPGRGRYVHPTRPRGLTLHEGARLQGFPDDYRWYKKEGDIPRNPLAHLIGDAVPPQLGYVAGLLALALI